MAQDINAATLSGQAVRLEPQVRAVFGPVLPSNLTHAPQPEHAGDHPARLTGSRLSERLPTSAGKNVLTTEPSPTRLKGLVIR